MADDIILGDEHFGTQDMKPDGGGETEANAIWARKMAANVGHVLGRWATTVLEVVVAGTNGTGTIDMTSYGFNEAPELHFLVNLGGTRLMWASGEDLWHSYNIHFMVKDVSAGSFVLEIDTEGVSAWTAANYGTVLWRARGF